MHAISKAAIVAGLLASATAAEAATFTVSITSIGTGRSIVGFDDNGQARTQPLAGFDATLVLNQVNDQYYTGSLYGYYLELFSSNGTTSFRTAATASYPIDLAGSLCVSTPLMAGVTYFNPGCGGFNVHTGSPGGFGSDYSGVVTSVRITEGATTTSSLTPIIPEPSTWALMLAGFGLTAYALRRRRVGFTAAA